MITHILALLALILLCVGWALFQQWLKRQDPDEQDAYQPGCGACGKGGCTSRE